MTDPNTSPPPPPNEPAGAPPTLPYGAGPANAYTGPAPTKDDINMALLIFILAIFTGFIGPLILWLLKKNESPFIDDQGKEVLNYQITTIIAIIICIPLMFILIGFLLYFVVIICYLIFTIMGAVKVSKGVAYRYPWALRLIK